MSVDVLCIEWLMDSFVHAVLKALIIGRDHNETRSILCTFPEQDSIECQNLSCVYVSDVSMIVSVDGD